MVFTPREDIEVAKSAICEEAADLFTPDARETITRACAAYLGPRKLTAIEILYSPRHQTDLMNSGTSAMQAVQKAASWQVRGMSVPVSERIRRLWDIIDQAKAAMAEEVEALDPAPMTPETAGALFARRGDESSPAHTFRILCSVAAGLADKKGWADKLDTLLKIAASADTPEALACIDRFLGELLRPVEVLPEVIGDLPTAGEAVASLLALLNGTARPTDAPPKAVLSVPFYKLMTRAPMPDSRAALAAHIVRLVSGPDKMTAKTLAEEIQAVVELRDTLVFEGALIGGEVTQEALERRLGRALSDQTIDMLMQGTRCVGERVMRAVALHSKVFGETAREYLEQYVADLMGQPQLEAKLVAEGLSLRQQIMALGALYRALKGSQLGDRAKGRMTRQVEQAQTALLDSSRLLEKLNDGSGSAAERLMRVVDLCREGAFTEGENADRARAAAQQLMKRPDFLASYLDGAEQKGERATRLRDLQRKLAEARIV
ncbi:hypothetical protein T8K17_24895 [Thalassobaculum sp. OXR-137]|uniref:hypothetical protein n=1 Tax=Thalassobaculum sp. OXR-137 TaxID=3100173 RepID=UPI002AC97901|nr:hypothetical protein [Thalassobaculum sp. OXR-137]WPZ34455.1 hypothetical protein T8K17_24895 [Thalassobaculum sp. OXR-137]